MIKTLKIEVRLSRVTGREAAAAGDRPQKGKSPKAMCGKRPPGDVGNTSITVIISVMMERYRSYPGITYRVNPNSTIILD